MRRTLSLRKHACALLRPPAPSLLSRATARWPTLPFRARICRMAKRTQVHSCTLPVFPEHRSHSLIPSSKKLCSLCCHYAPRKCNHVAFCELSFESQHLQACKSEPGTTEARDSERLGLETCRSEAVFALTDRPRLLSGPYRLEFAAASVKSQVRNVQHGQF